MMMSTSLIGLLKAMQFETRVSELDNIIDSINVLETEVVYYQNPLPEALRRSSCRSKGNINSVYEEIAIELDKKNGENLDYIWETKVRLKLANLPLVKEDIGIIADFGRELGLGNVEEQSKYFNYIKLLLRQQRDIAYDLMVKNSGLYKRLGILLGITIFIIVI